MFKSMKLGAKIISGFLVLVVFAAIVGLVGYDGVNTVADSLFVVGDKNAPVVEMVNKMKFCTAEAGQHLEEFLGAVSTVSAEETAILDEIKAGYEGQL